MRNFAQHSQSVPEPGTVGRWLPWPWYLRMPPQRWQGNCGSGRLLEQWFSARVNCRTAARLEPGRCWERWSRKSYAADLATATSGDFFFAGMQPLFIQTCTQTSARPLDMSWPKSSIDLDSGLTILTSRRDFSKHLSTGNYQITCLVQVFGISIASVNDAVKEWVPPTFLTWANKMDKSFTIMICPQVFLYVFERLND
jgi:hypothetical protein